MTLERNPDELWTHYLIRRLEAEGISLGEPYFEDTHWARATTGKVLTVELEFKDFFNSELFNQGTYADLADLLRRTLAEEVEVDNFQSKIVFSKDGTARFVPYEDDTTLEGVFEKYEVNTEYPAEQVIGDLVEFAKEHVSGTQQDLADAAELPPPEPAPERPTRMSREDISVLEKILRVVTSTDRQLKDLRLGDPGLALEDEKNYFPRLYGEAVNKGNLKWFNYKGESIWYVLVHSDQIGGKPGVPFENLYFVAEDKAPEEWQQRIIAVHESLCVKKSHAYAKLEEPKVALFLGKLGEYEPWRATLPDQDCKLDKR